MTLLPLPLPLIDASIYLNQPEPTIDQIWASSQCFVCFAIFLTLNRLWASLGYLGWATDRSTVLCAHSSGPGPPALRALLRFYGFLCRTSRVVCRLSFPKFSGNLIAFLLANCCTVSISIFFFFRVLSSFFAVCQMLLGRLFLANGPQRFCCSFYRGFTLLMI